MFALISDVHTPKPWIMLAKILLVIAAIVEQSKAFPIYPASKEWMCNSERVIYNVTLQGGIRSGKFRKLGIIGNMNTCTRSCCEDRNCDVAFMAKQNCYLVTCSNKFLCAPVATTSSRLYPRLAYITRTYFHANTNRNNDATMQHGDDKSRDNSIVSSNVLDNSKAIDDLDTKTSSNLQQQLLKYDNSLRNFEQPNKKDHILNGKETNSKATGDSDDDGVKVYSNGCYPAKIHIGVSLRYGTHSGEFYDYGEIGDMRMCVDLCCKDKKCDVAFMVGKTCYTISCSSFDFCQMVPSKKGPNISTQLAYVIKKKASGSKKKLVITENHEKYLRKQLLKEAEKKTVHATTAHVQEMQGVEMGTPKSDIFSSDEPNIPKKFTKGCRSNRILRNYGFIGGQRAGIYTLRGITPDFDSCIGLCCSEMMCDAAFLLGKRCFSIQCFKNGACAGKPATTHGLRSRLAFVERKDEDIGEKRTSIPGLLPTDRQYTVFLNITSEDFKEGLRDHESLEFLNFAQALRTAISGVLGNVEGFKYIEILKFKPNKVVAVFNVTTDQKTHPKVLLQLLVDSLRRGELKTYDEPFSGKILLDIKGFRFFNNKGDNLVCLPEFNFDASWPLAIFGTSVNIPCPRDATGLTNRKCRGSDNVLAKWDIPDFSECVTQKYEDLFKEAQLLNSAYVHSPELTPASIIDRLLQLTTSDTYGPSPPSQRRHNNVQSTRRYSNHPLNNRPMHVPVVTNRESLHSPQIENLRKLVAEKFKEKSKFLKASDRNGEQKQKPQINLLPFFRGPSAMPKVIHSAQQANVKVTSVKITSNKSPVSGPKLISSHYKNNPPSQLHSAPNLHALPGLQHSNVQAPPQLAQPKHFASLQPDSGQKQGNLGPQVTRPAQSPMVSPKQQTFPENHDQARLPSIRNLERAYSPEYRKFNGNTNVDPALLLSEAHWSKPEKFQPKTRSAPLQAPTNDDYPGHMFHTLSLPIENTAPRTEPLWDYSRKLPVKQMTPENDRNSMLNNGVVLPEGSPQGMHGFIGSIQSRRLDQSGFVGPMQSRRLDQSNQANHADQLFINPPTIANGLNHQLNPDSSSVHLQNEQMNPHLAWSETERSPIHDNKNDFAVSIKRRRKRRSNVDDDSLNTKPDPMQTGITTDGIMPQVNASFKDNQPSYDDVKVLGFNPTSLPKMFDKRDVLSDYRLVNSDEQANLMESLVSDDNEGGDLQDKGDKMAIASSNHPTNRITRNENVNFVQSINDKPTEYSVTEKKKIMKMLQENVKRLYAAQLTTPQPFHLIEKVNYKENDDDSDDNKKYEKPVIVNIPATAKMLTAEKSPALHNVRNASKSQQGTSLDLADELLKMTNQSPPDPKETSSYTEAHLSNPPINAIASAKILHADNTKGDGKTNTNIEITGGQGESPSPPDSQTTTTTTTTQNISGENVGQNLPLQQTQSVTEEKPNVESQQENQPTDTNQNANNEEAKPADNQQEVQGILSTLNSSEVEKKPTAEKQKPEEDIPTVPLTNIHPTENQIPLVNNKPYYENEAEIPLLKKLTVNETEENPAKSEGDAGKPDSMSTSENQHGTNRSAMFGGDILLSADIIEELSNYMEKQTEAPSPQEVKEFFAAASALLDENNAQEWKNAQRHMKVLANEGDVTNGDIDVQDWRSLHKMQSKRKPNILMELVDDIEVYGKAATRTINKYNDVSQKPIFTQNIFTQFKVLIVEDLDDSQSSNNVISFPNFTNPMVAKWMTTNDRISLPTYLIAESIQPTAMIHVSFFVFKTVYKLQRFQDDIDEEDDQEILDESPMKVGSELISMAIHPPLPDHLRMPVVIDLQKINYDSKAQHECAFWNSTMSDWSTKGCKLVSFNDTHASCECNHLTTFGILVDSSKPQAPVGPDYGGPPVKPIGGPVPGDSSKPAESPAPAPAPVPTPSKVPKSSKEPTSKTPVGESSGTKTDLLFWLLIGLVILLIILLFCLCCLFCWLRRRKNEEPAKTKETGSSSGSGTSVGSELLVDKSKQPKGEKARSESPLPGQSPGWLKLKSHADHTDEMLMKEKALLFSDYHQPYHFLQKDMERPNTSLESNYGGSDLSVPPKTSSSSSSAPKDENLAMPRPSKRPDHRQPKYPYPKQNRPKAPLNNEPAKKSPPRDVRKKEVPLQKPADRSSGPNRKRNGTKSGTTGPKPSPDATPPSGMEWDPYYLNTKKNEEDKKKLDKKLNGAKKKSRNISPISEESTLGPETDPQAVDSLAPQAGSDIEPGPVSESIYPLSSSDQSDQEVETKTLKRRSPPGSKTRNQTTQIGGRK
eukprot:gene17447-19192_t